MLPDIRIVACEAEDPVFQACLERYYEELQARFENGFDPGPGYPPGPGERHLLAMLNGGAAGCGMMRPFDRNTAEIRRVWVAPDARGCGIAGAIMDALERTATNESYARIVLDTNKALKEAQSMYLRRGYVEIQRYNDNPFAHHWFEKRL